MEAPWPSAPTDKPQWTDTNERGRAIPSADKRLKGWLPGECPPAEYMNWLFFSIGTEWLNYFTAITSKLKGLSAVTRVVSKDPNIPFGEALSDCCATLKDGDQVLIRDWPDPLAAPLAIKANNVAIMMLSSVSLTAAPGLAPIACAFQVSANGVRINGGRLAGFDVGIIVEAASRFCFFTELRFFLGTNSTAGHQLVKYSGTSGDNNAQYHTELGNIDERR